MIFTIAAVKYSVCENDLTHSIEQNEQNVQDNCYRYGTHPAKIEGEKPVEADNVG
jgi:hypothetical protein